MQTYLGVIEGFFGRAWSFPERHDYAGFLKQNGYQFYIYAPKGDAYLRKSWQQEWPVETSKQLKNLVGHYQSLGLDFGLGLSPFEIYKNYNADAKKSLQKKIKQLNQLGVDILCLLFDDMRGDQPDLAKTQIKITQDVRAQTTAKKVIMCPTYYSFTPKLEKLFGAMPYNYFEDLGEGLPSEVDIFWTGPEICSRDYPEIHLEKVIQLLGRKPFLWDNYPVNDGADISRFLFLKAFENRPFTLANLTAGHAVNPMNQPWLSRIPLYSLPRSYSQGKNFNPESILQEALQQLCGKYEAGQGGGNLAQKIASDINNFQVLGLDKLGETRRRQLLHAYRQFDSPYSREIIGWLNEEYAFDPACLTG
jgi:hypothetical protein